MLLAHRLEQPCYWSRNPACAWLIWQWSHHIMLTPNSHVTSTVFVITTLSVDISLEDDNVLVDILCGVLLSISSFIYQTQQIYRVQFNHFTNCIVSWYLSIYVYSSTNTNCMKFATFVPFDTLNPYVHGTDSQPLLITDVTPKNSDKLDYNVKTIWESLI